MNYVTDITENKASGTEKEIWRWIPGYEGLYKVSNLGNVLSFKRYPDGKPLKLITGVTGYVYFLTSKDNKQQHFKLHRIVCELFNGKPPTSKHHTNHIDGNKQNKHASNLEWNTPKQNVIHAFTNGLAKGKRGTKKQPIVKKDLNGNILEVYSSMVESAKDNGIHRYGISLACRKKLHTYKGYIWQYYTEAEEMEQKQ